LIKNIYICKEFVSPGKVYKINPSAKLGEKLYDKTKIEKLIETSIVLSVYFNY